MTIRLKNELRKILRKLSVQVYLQTFSGNFRTLLNTDYTNLNNNNRNQQK
jgi:hypothetical protein